MNWLKKFIWIYQGLPVRITTLPKILVLQQRISVCSAFFKCFFEFSIAHSVYFKAENIKGIFLNWQNSTKITSVFHFSTSKLESVMNIIKINVPQKVVILIERGTLWSSIKGLKVKQALYISNVSNKICPILLSFTISTYWEIFINKQMFSSFI